MSVTHLHLVLKLTMCAAIHLYGMVLRNHCDNFTFQFIHGNDPNHLPDYKVSQHIWQYMVQSNSFQTEFIYP
jgi:hypothetical protein